MQRLGCCVVILLMPYVSGCQRHPDASATAHSQQPKDTDVVQQPDKKDASTFEIADLLDALQMNMWKARVNEDGKEPIRKVSLCIKPKGSDPKTVLTLDLADKRHGPGTLLVFLQALGNRRNKVGIVYHGDNGRSGSTSNLVDDPFADFHGLTSEGSVGIGRPGIIVLKSSALPGGSDITQQDSVAIYLNNE